MLAQVKRKANPKFSSAMFKKFFRNSLFGLARIISVKLFGMMFENDFV